MLVELSEPEPALRAELEAALKGKRARLVLAQPLYPSSIGRQELRSLEVLERASELEVAEQAFSQRYGGAEMPDEMRALLSMVISEIQEDEDL